MNRRKKSTKSKELSRASSGPPKNRSASAVPASPTTQSLEITASREIFSGPLPRPDILARYDQVCPGAADRIIKMAEDQAAHRQRLESEVILSNTRNQTLGTVSALTISLSVMGLAAYLAAQGQALWGLAAVLIELGGLAYIFVFSKNKNSKELKEKRKEMRELAEEAEAAESK